MADIVGLIPESGKTELRPASYVRGIAAGALLASNTAAIAKEINCAANTGAYNVIINHPLSDDIIQVLEDNGYTVTRDGLANATDQYLIDWKE